MIAALVALIGISRILLGVHYLSDVVGAWALGVTWLGLALAYYSIYPVGFYVTSLAFGLYVVVRLTRALAMRRPESREPATDPA